jgi:uncharacterized protein YegL
MRRLPVYFLLDTSGSMNGEPIQAMNNALSSMINTLRTDPHALDSLWLCLFTFDREVNELVPLTDLASFQLPEITCPASGPTNMGAALQLLCRRVPAEVLKGTTDTKGDWRPLLFIMTDGAPSDIGLYRECIPAVKALNFASIVACAAGPKAKDEYLKELTDHVVHLDTADTSTLKQFFRWVTETIDMGSKTQGTGTSIQLPDPPENVHLVV